MMWGRGTRSQARPRLALQELEERIAPSGNVVITSVGGTVFLTGDAGDNEFTLLNAPNDPDELVIIPGVGTTLNSGHGTIGFPGTTAVRMNLGDGDDSVVLNGLTLIKDVVVDMGAGTNSLVVTNASSIGGSLTVKSASASSADSLVINDSAVAHNVSITTKTGGQTVSILGSDIGGNVSMKIQHLDGDGDDTILNSTIGGKVSLAIAQGYHVLGSDPGDSIPFNITASQVGSVAVQAKGGDYAFNFVGSQTSEAKHGSINVNYGAGDSYTYIGGASTIYGSVSVKTGSSYSWLDQLLGVVWDTEFTLEGDSVVNGKLAVTNLDSDDTVTVETSDVLQGVSINNGTGDATITLLGGIIGRSGDKTFASKITTGANGFGYPDDTVTLTFDEVRTGPLALSFGPQSATLGMHDLDVTGNLSLTTGANDDFVQFNNLSVTKNTTIKTGFGDDTLTITEHNSPLGALSIDTGAGNDSMSFDGGTGDGSSDYYGKVQVLLGTGDDSMSVGDVHIGGNAGRYHAAVKFDGGAGTDSIVYMNAENTFDLLPVILFENKT